MFIVYEEIKARKIEYKENSNEIVLIENIALNNFLYDDNYKIIARKQTGNEFDGQYIIYALRDNNILGDNKILDVLEKDQIEDFCRHVEIYKEKNSEYLKLEMNGEKKIDDTYTIKFHKKEQETLMQFSLYKDDKQIGSRQITSNNFMTYLNLGVFTISGGSDLNKDFIGKGLGLHMYNIIDEVLPYQQIPHGHAGACGSLSSYSQAFWEKRKQHKVFPDLNDRRKNIMEKIKMINFNIPNAIPDSIINKDDLLNFLIKEKDIHFLNNFYKHFIQDDTKFYFQEGGIYNSYVYDALDKHILITKKDIDYVLIEKIKQEITKEYKNIDDILSSKEKFLEYFESKHYLHDNIIKNKLKQCFDEIDWEPIKQKCKQKTNQYGELINHIGNNIIIVKRNNENYVINKDDNTPFYYQKKLSEDEFEEINIRIDSNIFEISEILEEYFSFHPMISLKEPNFIKEILPFLNFSQKDKFVLYENKIHTITEETVFDKESDYSLLNREQMIEHLVKNWLLYLNPSSHNHRDIILKQLENIGISGEDSPEFKIIEKEFLPLLKSESITLYNKDESVFLNDKNIEENLTNEFFQKKENKNGY